MKTLVDYINESKTLTPSKDITKNKIMEYLLEDFKIVWNVKTYDEALDEITDKKDYYNDYVEPKTMSDADKIYIMKCCNGGSTLNKYSKWNCAEICDYKNNTDTAWLFVVKDREVKVYLHERRYYGLNAVKELIHEFKI